MTSYPAYFGLISDPFTKGRRAFSPVSTEEYQEVLFRLDYLRYLGGFGLITGEPGCGKTMALKSWAESLPTSSYKVIYTSITNISTGEFYRIITDELGLEPSYRKSDNYRKIQEEIRRLSEEKGTTPVFIIDEASDLSSALLEDLKSLFNFDMDSRNKSIIILAGLPRLNKVLRSNRHEPLRQRIVMNCAMEGLSEEGTSDYIKAKLTSVKGPADLFTKDALTAISSASKGVPRVIDKLCTRCLIVAEQAEKSVINAETVLLASRDMELR